ncbi:unnamed protein product [Durusdinium trenchii]|uniref:CMP-sialic acid transporter 1 (CMP-SA-Tr 1) (CMP-Sia-Tr 1) n=2 Tax=Durusdinium trenchii TaxID=1381693 RepID=A0ABP0L298_9DINO
MDGVDSVSMLCCLPLQSVESPKVAGSNGTLGKSLKHKAPGLFDELAAPCDVLPVSSSLRRVVGIGQPQKEIRRIAWYMFFFVLLDTSKGLLVSWSAVHSCEALVPVALCAKNMLSVILGLCLGFLLEGRSGLRRCLQLQRNYWMLPVAACFCAAQMAMLEALRTFNAGSLKIMAQVNLPTTAVLSRVLLGRRYTTQQWAAIALVAAAVAAFAQVRLLYFRPPYWSREGHFLRPNLGVLSLLSSIFLSCSASILAERCLTRGDRVAFYIQKTNIMLGELLTSFLLTAIYLHSLADSQGVMENCSFDQVADYRNILVVVVWTLHGWMAGLLVKECSAFAKNVGHMLSASAMYFFPIFFITGPVNNGPVTACALLVLIAILVWALAPSRQRAEESRLHHGVQYESPASGPLQRPFLRKVQSMEQVTAMKAALEASLEGDGFHYMGVLVISFIILDATKPFFVSWAHANKAPEEAFNNITLVLVQTSLSVAVGLLVAMRPSISWSNLQVSLHSGWRSRVWNCVDPVAVQRQLPVSFCLVMSKLCLIMALEKLDAGSVRVLCQSSLPLVGVAGALLFRRRYSAMQWCSLAGVTVALGCFYYVKHQVTLRSKSSQHQVGAHSQRPEMHFDFDTAAGSLLTLASIGFNCLGALLVEKFLKKKNGYLYEQKTQLVCGEVFFNIVLLVAMPFLFTDPEKQMFHSVWQRGFFTGWDLRVLICALVWIPSGWTATMLVKEASNVLKVVAQGAASVLTYVFSLTPLVPTHRSAAREPVSPPVVVLALSVLFAALTFGLDSVHRKQGQQKSETDESQESLLRASKAESLRAKGA